MISGPLYYFVADGMIVLDLSYDLVAYDASQYSVDWPASLLSNTFQWTPFPSQFVLESNEALLGIFLANSVSAADAVGCLTNLVSAYSTKKGRDIADLRADLTLDGCPSLMADLATGLSYSRSRGYISVDSLMSGHVIRFAPLALALLCALYDAIPRYPIMRQISASPGPGPGPGPTPTSEWTPESGAVSSMGKSIVELVYNEGKASEVLELLSDSGDATATASFNPAEDDPLDEDAYNFIWHGAYHDLNDPVLIQIYLVNPSVLRIASAIASTSDIASVLCSDYNCQIL